jgi:hypothetical protein
MDIAVWLRGLDLEGYEAAFRDNEIDWEVLPKLTSEATNADVISQDLLAFVRG